MPVLVRFVLRAAKLCRLRQAFTSAARSAEGDQTDGSGKAASDLYGAEHLVRLFVKLPELVPVAFMTPPVRDAVCRGPAHCCGGMVLQQPA